MTCRYALSLRDDYLDRELDPGLAAEIEAHLAVCPDCRREFAESHRLTELLKSHQPGLPAEDYWSETSDLILARTVDAPGANQPHRVPPRSGYDRRELIRSSLALAASICIFFLALYIGSHHQREAKRLNPPGAPVLITASLEGLVGDSETSIMTHREYASLVGGRFMVGTPGPLGKGFGLFDLLTF